MCHANGTIGTLSVTPNPAPVDREDVRADGAVRSFGGSWPERHAAALALRLAVVALPLALAQLTTFALSRRWSKPADLGSLALWWVGLVIVAVVIVESASLVTRRLLPLAALMRLPLAFPSSVPSRFRVALRSGNPRHLERASDPSDDDASRAAMKMLELVAELTLHDRATRGHSERVRAYAELIGEELGLGADDRDRLRWGALLHDLGKLRTPAGILNKAGRLTDEEFDQIKRHPLDGLELAMPLWPWLGAWVLAISDHHERWEGGGYPSGAAGSDIALAGRIVAVADAYDVMTSARSYKAPVSVADARAELVRCSGTQFDPTVVRAFLAVPAPRLRRVAGPVSVLVPVLSLPQAMERLRRGAYTATGAAAIAVASVTAAFAPPGSVDESASPLLERSPEQPVDRVALFPPDRPTGSVGPPGVPSVDESGSSDDRADASGPRRGDGPLVDILLPEVPRTPPSGPPTEEGPPNLDESSPGGQDPPRPPPQAEPVALTVSPRSGEVVVEGLPIGELPIADVDAAGSIVCARMGMCDDIVVETPIVLPRFGP